MRSVTEVWVNRNDYRNTKIVKTVARALEDGEVRVAIDKFGLTSNNVSYAVSGDMIGYWKYYPANDPWGKVPVWGIGEVVESNTANIAWRARPFCAWGRRTRTHSWMRHRTGRACRRSIISIGEQGASQSF